MVFAAIVWTCRGGGGGVITLMDIMKDTKTLLQMEGYQIGKPDEKESEKDHGLHIQDTE